MEGLCPRGDDAPGARLKHRSLRRPALSARRGGIVPACDLEEASHCWLCERPLGRRVEWHHPVPKSRGGRVTVPVHPICHRTIHALFTNAELQRSGAREDLAGTDAMRKYLLWIANKPPDFHAPTRRPR